MARAIVVCALLVCCTACAKTYVTLREGAPRSVDAEDYREVYRTWTREVKVIPLDGLENILTARATYLSPEFREAYVVRMAADLDMTAEEKQALRAKEVAGAERGHEFYVTLMTGVKDCDKLEPDEGPWLIRLRDDSNREVAPLSVEEIDRPMANDIKYFGFDPGLRKAYRLVFPKMAADGRPILSGATRYFDLSFSAAYGKNSARWEIGPGS